MTEPGRALRYAGFIDRHRRAILALSVVLAAGGGWLAAQLPLYGDFSYLLPQTAPSVVQLRQLEQRVKNLGTVMVAIEAEDQQVRAAAALELRDRLRKLVPGLLAEVQFDDGPARRFIWEHRWLYVDTKDLQAAHDALEEKIRDAKLAANPLYVSLEDDDAGAGKTRDDRTAKLREKLDEAEKKKTSEGFVSRDCHMQLIILKTDFEAGAASKAGEVVSAVRAAAAETGRAYPVAIGVTGDVISGLQEHDALLKGIVQAAVLTALIVALGLVIYYRSVRAVLALLWALTVGTALTFGVTRLAIGHLNLASGFLSSIVIGNGINFGIIVLARHLEERRRGQRGIEAIAAALGGTLTGTLAAALTATVAYGSLVSTNFKGFRHFGVIGGVGMALCWIAAYTILPALLAVLERGGLKPRREPLLGRLLARLLPASRTAAAVVAGVALAVSGVAGYATWRYLQNPYEGNFRNLRSSSPEIDDTRRWLGKIDDAFGNNISGGFVVAAPTREQARLAVKKLRAVDEGKPPAQHLLGGIRSIDDVLPADQDKKLALLADLRRMLDHEADRLSEADRADLARLRPPDDVHPLTEADLPDQIAWMFSEKDGARGKLVLADASVAYDTWLGPQLLEFTARVEALQLGEGVILGGANFVFADVIRSMEGDGPRSTAIALVGAVLVIGLLVGVGRHGLVTLVCMASGTLLMLAGAWLSGLRVNFLDFVALPITIGIGIDYSVNIVARARREGPGSARRALETTGGAVALCSFTTIVGYGSLLLSVNQGIRSFGLAAILGELTCISSALVLAPTLLELLVRRPRTLADASRPSVASPTSVEADGVANSNEKPPRQSAKL